MRLVAIEQGLKVSLLLLDIVERLVDARLTFFGSLERLHETRNLQRGYA